MAPALGHSLATADFSFPTAERSRALWVRTQRALKEFLFGAPEDALLAAVASTRMRPHVAVFALLTLPLAFAWLPTAAIGRWAILCSLISGLLLAAGLESSGHGRGNPFAVLAVSALYAVSLSGVAFELFGPRALDVEPSVWLAAIAVGGGYLALRGDPRVCLLAAVVGVFALAALLLGGPHAMSLGRAWPYLGVAVASGFACTLAAQRGRALRRLAILDTVSGALHASAFERCLAAALDRPRGKPEPVMLARIELSALADIRAAHGSAFADALLRWLAAALVDRFRATDLLGRTGEDEFSLVLRDTDHPAIENRLEQLRCELGTIELKRGGVREPIALRISYGLAAFPREATDPASTQRLAAQRLALSKWRERHAA
jgi:diguanylate cyclase (GGDEF)-like protein